MAYHINMSTNPVIKCFGCGGLVPDIDGVTHKYVLSAPGCWRVYGEILSKEYGEYGYPSIHRITVDAYSVQHPGKPVRQAVQSVAVHLISLYYVLEMGYDFKRATQAMSRATQFKNKFFWLEPPAFMGEITVVDVARTMDYYEYEKTVKNWGLCAWTAWANHHTQICEWAKL
jgi:hypothetical protein